MRISDKFIRDVKNRIYSLPMNLHTHQLYLLEQHSESSKIGSAFTRINTDRLKSMIMKLGPGDCFTQAGMQNLSLKSNLNS